MSVYGSQLWDLSSTECNRFYVVWRKAVRKLLGLPMRTHCDLLHEIVFCLPIDTQLHKRFIQFAVNCLNSANRCINMCAHLAVNGSSSKFCKSMNFIAHRYKINKYDLHSHNISHAINKWVNTNHYEVNKCKAGAIREFITWRNELWLNMHTLDYTVNLGHLQIIIDDLCCN